GPREQEELDAAAEPRAAAAVLREVRERGGARHQHARVGLADGGAGRPVLRAAGGGCRGRPGEGDGCCAKTQQTSPPLAHGRTTWVRDDAEFGKPVPGGRSLWRNGVAAHGATPSTPTTSARPLSSVKGPRSVTVPSPSKRSDRTATFSATSTRPVRLPRP